MGEPVDPQPLPLSSYVPSLSTLPPQAPSPVLSAPVAVPARTRVTLPSSGPRPGRQAAHTGGSPVELLPISSSPGP
eukprot:NODE_4489_length_576_cov_103.119545_g3260_i0.p2 GENE.NODE_4489_length_576_cov_103.119545_g3260_i0~~NODE_4489_length_576_cov_103.119545_g3260_i0.p2  ORF type:complete len:84 (+),score=27.95 NODE_4489_length_576_cov_103.119545_g3260_i0:25-252(+)